LTFAKQIVSNYSPVLHWHIFGPHILFIFIQKVFLKSFGTDYIQGGGISFILKTLHYQKLLTLNFTSDDPILKTLFPVKHFELNVIAILTFYMMKIRT
jgi:hypothetical protein